MYRSARRGFALILVSATLLACTRHEPYSLSDKDKKRFATIVRVPAARPSAAPIILGLSDCAVYKAVIENTDIVDWKIVLRSDWEGSYPKFVTVCTRESMHYDGRFVRVDLCAQAIGAGGGCADGGEYRSTNGDRWQIPTRKGWEPMGR